MFSVINILKPLLWIGKYRAGGHNYGRLTPGGVECGRRTVILLCSVYYGSKPHTEDLPFAGTREHYFFYFFTGFQFFFFGLCTVYTRV